MSPRGISGGRVLAHVRELRQPKTVRVACARLVPNGGHRCLINMGGRRNYALSRDRVEELSGLLSRLPEADVLALTELLAPDLAFARDDLSFVTRALAAFSEVVELEDRRPDQRSHEHTVTLDV